MIREALDFLVTQINEYIYVKTGYTDKVVLRKIALAGGSEIAGNGTVVCQVVNIEEERIGKAQLPTAPPISGNFPLRNPEIKINLSLLFATNPDDEGESEDYLNTLRLLSNVIQFFQYRHVFNASNSPSLPSKIETLVVEMYPLSLENQNYLWGSLGVKYRPSIVYKVRLLTILDDTANDLVGAPRVLDQRAQDRNP